MATLGGYYRDNYQSAFRPVAGSPWVAHLLLLTTFAFVLFDERFTLAVATGGRGALQPCDFLVAVFGVLMFLGLGGISGPRLFPSDRRGYFWAPYVILTIALPTLGVFLRSEAPRTMYTSIEGVIQISFLLFGAWAALSVGPVRRLAKWYAWIAIIVEFLVALIDYLNKTGMYPTAFGKFLLQSNLQDQGALGDLAEITLRSVGTFLNPNDLGFWSVVAFWMSALLFRGFFRFTGVIAALSTLVLSQSRGSLLSLLATSVVWLAYLTLSRDARLRKTRDISYLSAICFVLTVCWLGAALTQSNGITVSDKFSVVDRFESGLNVLTQGASADSNANARVTAWHRALDFYYEHPLGTWVSPRLKFHLYIDNEYVKDLLQGSILYVFALLLLISCSLWRIMRPGAVPRLVAMIVVTAGVNAMSAYPFSYPAMGLFWIFLGYDLAQERMQKQALAEARRVARQALALRIHAGLDQEAGAFVPGARSFYPQVNQ